MKFLISSRLSVLAFTVIVASALYTGTHFSQAADTKAPTTAPKAEEKTPANSEQTGEPGAIKGTVHVTLRNGRRQAMKGIGIAILPKSAEETVIKARNEAWLARAPRWKYDDGFNNLDLKYIGGTAVRLAVARTKGSKEDSTFRVINLPPSEYLVYCQYKSHYAVAYWLYPVKVISGEEVVIALDENNAREIHNKFK